MICTADRIYLNAPLAHMARFFLRLGPVKRRSNGSAAYPSTCESLACCFKRRHTANPLWSRVTAISVERKRLFEPPSSYFIPRSVRRLSQYPHFLPIALPHHSASGPAGLFLRRVRRRLAGSRSFTERVTGSWEESQWSRAHASYSGAYNFFVAGRERPFKHAIALCSGAWPGGCGKDRARAHAVGREKVDYKP